MRAVRPTDFIVPLVMGTAAAVVVWIAVSRTHSVAAGVAAAAAVLLLVVSFAARKALRRLRVARQSLTGEQRAWLRDHAAVYAAAPAEGQARFERDVRFLLADLTFEAVDGVDLTDELKLSVAAGGATLLHGRPEWELPLERTILFVPHTFDEAYGDEEAGVYDGMVHAQGPVVLAADAALAGWRRADGSNVVLHELAHLFDIDGTGADGVPTFLDRGSTSAWLALADAEMRKARTGQERPAELRRLRPRRALRRIDGAVLRAPRAPPRAPPGPVRGTLRHLRPDPARRSHGRRRGLDHGPPVGRVTVVGIDCATDPRNVGLALGRSDGQRATLLDVRLGSRAVPPHAVVAEWIGDGPALLALDAPLGWPAPLGRMLATHRAGAPLADDAHMLFRRETDRVVKQRLGKQSLDVGADRIARTAHAALALLEAVGARIGRPIPLAWAPGEAGAIEVYPAATLRSHGIASAGYKKPENVAVRDRIAGALGARLAIEAPRDVLTATDHALDAALCVLAAHDFLSGATLPPDSLPLARVEGWIWIRPLPE